MATSSQSNAGSQADAENIAKPWGGVFDGQTAPLVEKFTESVSYDRRLYTQDIRGSIAHAQMLASTGVLTDQEASQIVAGLEEIGREIAAGNFVSAKTWKMFT